MSHSSEVLVGDRWMGDHFRFHSLDEAQRYGKTKILRWYVPTDSRTAEVDEPANAVFNEEMHEPQMKGQA